MDENYDMFEPNRLVLNLLGEEGFYKDVYRYEGLYKLKFLLKLWSLCTGLLLCHVLSFLYVPYLNAFGGNIAFATLAFIVALLKGNWQPPEIPDELVSIDDGNQDAGTSTVPRASSAPPSPSKKSSARPSTGRAQTDPLKFSTQQRSFDARVQQNSPGKQGSSSSSTQDGRSTSLGSSPLRNGATPSSPLSRHSQSAAPSPPAVHHDLPIRPTSSDTSGQPGSTNQPGSSNPSTPSPPVYEPGLSTPVYEPSPSPPTYPPGSPCQPGSFALVYQPTAPVYQPGSTPVYRPNQDWSIKRVSDPASSAQLTDGGSNSTDGESSVFLPPGSTTICNQGELLEHFAGPTVQDSTQSVQLSEDVCETQDDAPIDPEVLTTDGEDQSTLNQPESKEKEQKEEDQRREINRASGSQQNQEEDKKTTNQEAAKEEPEQEEEYGSSSSSSSNTKDKSKEKHKASIDPKQQDSVEGKGIKSVDSDTGSKKSSESWSSVFDEPKEPPSKPSESKASTAAPAWIKSSSYSGPFHRANVNPLMRAKATIAASTSDATVSTATGRQAASSGAPSDSEPRASRTQLLDLLRRQGSSGSGKTSKQSSGGSHTPASSAPISPNVMAPISSDGSSTVEPQQAFADDASIAPIEEVEENEETDWKEEPSATWHIDYV